MIDILALVFALLCPALVMFWRLKHEHIWITVARCLAAITVFWCWMAWAQHYDLAAMVRDGRSHNMGEAASMAGYIFGPSFWIFPGSLYAGLLLLIRVLWRIRLRRTGAA
ncbi:MAG TPA: hypothetical protein VFA71_13765 [Terriglobales bacterium]|nr:hypothetical protein [Terriglobales bacterium]